MPLLLAPRSRTEPPIRQSALTSPVYERSQLQRREIGRQSVSGADSSTVLCWCRSARQRLSKRVAEVLSGTATRSRCAHASRITHPMIDHAMQILRGFAPRRLTDDDSVEFVCGRRISFLWRNRRSFCPRVSVTHNSGNYKRETPRACYLKRTAGVDMKGGIMKGNLQPPYKRLSNF